MNENDVLNWILEQEEYPRWTQTILAFGEENTQKVDKILCILRDKGYIVLDADEEILVITSSYKTQKEVGTMKYYCAKDGMGGTFKCIYFGSIYQNGGTCSKEGSCEHKKPSLLETKSRVEPRAAPNHHQFTTQTTTDGILTITGTSMRLKNTLIILKP